MSNNFFLCCLRGHKAFEILQVDGWPFSSEIHMLNIVKLLFEIASFRSPAAV